MDPNAVLAEFRQHKADADKLGVDHPRYAEVITLAVNAAEALDEWLSRGGFPPEEWREGPDAIPKDYDPDKAYADAEEYMNDRDYGDNYTGPTFRETED